MLKFMDFAVNANDGYIENYYFFKSNDGKLYYWKTSNSNIYNACVQNGKLIGFDALEYTLTGKSIFHIGNIFDEIKVTKWKTCI